MTGGDETLTVTADLGKGAKGFVVIDSTVHNASSGGLRVTEDLDLEEVAALAREMTLKFSFIGRPAGGAKSGIRLAPGTTAAEKTRVLTEFGYRFGPLLRRGIYSPGTDMNCSSDELALVYAAAGLPGRSFTDTALFTAIGAADAIAAWRQSIGAPARPLQVAIEGFGAVCAGLAARLPPEQFRIVAISTARGAVHEPDGFDASALVQARNAFGDGLVHHLAGVRCDLDALFSIPVDVLVPSARTGSVSRERAAAVNAAAVLPVANAPYADGAVPILEARGITCLPGFVVNSAGVFASSLFDSGVPMSAVERLSRERFGAVVRALIETSSRVHMSPVAVAEDIAMRRLAQRRATTPFDTMARRVARAISSELSPRAWRGARTLVRFSENLVELERMIREYEPSSAAPARPAVA